MVVSNTSPISNLAAIGQLSLLRAMFGTVSVPRAVLRELQAWKNPEAFRLIDKAIQERWIVPMEASDSRRVAALENTHQIDLGEAEAIVLASEQNAAYLLMDETEGRAAANACGLACTGVVGILLRAKASGLIPSLSKTLRELRSANFYLSNALEQLILRESGESK
jgi:predicted nucleic acid-binding protein